MSSVPQRFVRTVCIAVALTACLCVRNAHTAPGQSTATSAMTMFSGHRPRIGLVLSGGGARGYAHIGILEYLEKHHIPVDYIAASSVGALVGGLYASGMSATELKQRLTTINLDDIAFDRKGRAQLRQSLREDGYTYPIGLSLGYGNGQFRLASAIVEGTELLMLIQNWTPQFPSKIAFNTLPTPFAAIATDLANGNKVVLTEGLLSHAMRASMAVPGLFSAFEIDRQTLVDGGITSNLPVAQVRRMGADIVIAINIGSPLHPPDTLTSPAAMAQQMLGMFIHNNVRHDKALLTPYDILIEPDLAHFSFTDFLEAATGIAAGLEAANKNSEQLNRLSLPPDQWARYQQERQARLPARRVITIDAIEIDMYGSRIPPAVIKRELEIYPGDIYDVSAINNNLTQLSNSNFNHVTQELITDKDTHTLKINVKEKNWGPQFFLFGFGMSNNFNGRGNFNLQIGHRYPWMTSTGLGWYNDAMVGTSQVGLRSELQQSLFNTLNTWDLYLAPYVDYRARYETYNQETADNKGDVLNTQYRSENTTVGMDIGAPIALFGKIRTGLNYQIAKRPATRNMPDTVRPDTASMLFHQTAWHTQLTIDQLDDPLFAKHGYYLFAETNVGLGAPAERYNSLHIRTLQASGVQRDTLHIAMEAARVLEPAARTAHPGFSLGGFQRLSVYSSEQFTGDYLLYGRLTYLSTLNAFRLPGLTSTIMGVSLEAGNVWQAHKTLAETPLKKNLALFIGGNSPVGPVYLGGAIAPHGLWNMYLQIGRVF